MAGLKTTRPFQQRFLDGFDRSQLRQEVEKVKPRRFQRLRNQSVGWALGASLAVGGIGAPLLVIHDSHNQTQGPRTTEHTVSSDTGVSAAITGDLKAARSIASKVAGGVGVVAKHVEKGVVQAATAPLAAIAAAPAAIAAAPQQLAKVAEDAKAHFFATNVPFGSIIYNEAKKNNVRPELVAAMIQQESRFKPTARSSTGAQGLMQLVPKTGRWMGARNLMNPVENIQAGAKYLKYLHEQFNGNETKAIAAYNAGEGNVRRFGGVPPFRETQNYVKNVRSFEQDYHDRVATHTADLAASMPAGMP
ncbi:MAG: lytic transglycosylase domain-containing protein [Thermoanaerobaculia bacterium]